MWVKFNGIRFDKNFSLSFISHHHHHHMFFVTGNEQKMRFQNLYSFAISVAYVLWISLDLSSKHTTTTMFYVHHGSLFFHWQNSIPFILFTHCIIIIIIIVFIALCFSFRSVKSFFSGCPKWWNWKNLK